MSDIALRLGKGILVIEGALDSQLVRAGMPAGACPDELNIMDAEMVADAHRSNLLSGVDCIVSNTRGATAHALAAFEVADDADAINRAGVRIARGMHPEHVLAAVGPCGLTIEPRGGSTFDDVHRQYSDQVKSLAAESPEAILIVSMTDIADARCALIAAREACDLPVIVGCTFGEDGRMPGSGTDPATAAIVLGAVGASAVGIDGGVGFETAEKLLVQMERVTELPVMVRADVGVVDGGGYPKAAVIGLTASGAASHRGAVSLAAAWAQRLRDDGAALIGAAEGSHPAVTGAMAAMVKGDEVRRSPCASAGGGMLLAGPRAWSRIGGGAPCRTIGGRINTTGQGALAASLRAGDLSLACGIGREQVSAGADLLDVNVGEADVDVADVFPRLAGALAGCCDAPLVFDCSDPMALERSLRGYPGRALVNSVTGDQESLERVLPCAVRYGAAVIVLAMEGGVVPDTAHGRIAVIDRVRDAALRAGLTDADLLYDVLAMPEAHDASANDVAYETLRLAHERGLLTLMGVSNVSFGLADRVPPDAACATCAIGAGVDAVIIDPREVEVMEAIGRARYSTVP